MIEPMMATMLGFVTTDAGVEPALLQRALKAAADDTFNAITRRRRVLDQRLRLRAGQRRQRRAARRGGLSAARRGAAAGVRAAGDRHRPRRRGRDQADHGPGDRREDRTRTRRRTARAIANSPLVKTAVHGGDPNWGRLVAVAGRAGVGRSSLERAAVRIGPVELFADGAPYDERAPEAAEYLQGKDIDDRGRSRHRRQRRSRGCGPAI